MIPIEMYRFKVHRKVKGYHFTDHPIAPQDHNVCEDEVASVDYQVNAYVSAGKRDDKFTLLTTRWLISHC